MSKRIVGVIYDNGGSGGWKFARGWTEGARGTEQKVADYRQIVACDFGYPTAVVTGTLTEIYAECNRRTLERAR